MPVSVFLPYQGYGLYQTIQFLNHYNPTKANVFKRTTDLENQFTQISFGSTIKKDRTFEKTLESNTLWNNTVLGGFLKTNIESKELKDATDWFTTYLRPLIHTKTVLDSYVTSRIDKSEILYYLNILNFPNFLSILI